MFLIHNTSETFHLPHGSWNMVFVLQHFAAPVSYSETGCEYLDDADNDTVFIVEEFAGSVFETLRNDECRIVGPPVVIHAALHSVVTDS